MHRWWSLYIVRIAPVIHVAYSRHSKYGGWVWCMYHENYSYSCKFSLESITMLCIAWFLGIHFFVIIQLYLFFFVAFPWDLHGFSSQSHLSVLIFLSYSITLMIFFLSVPHAAPSTWPSPVMTLNSLLCPQPSLLSHASGPTLRNCAKRLAHLPTAFPCELPASPPKTSLGPI